MTSRAQMALELPEPCFIAEQGTAGRMRRKVAADIEIRRLAAREGIAVCRITAEHGTHVRYEEQPNVRTVLVTDKRLPSERDCDCKVG